MSRFAIFPVLFISLTLMLTTVDQVYANTSVLFDQGHGQRLIIEGYRDFDLSSLAGVFRETGHKVVAVNAPLTADLLFGIDALILSGTFQPYTPNEIEVITAFVERGGTLCIMLHIAPPLDPLLHRLGVEYSNGVIREKENTIEGNPLNFRVTRLANHPLFQGLQQFSLYGVWALLDKRLGVQAIARTSSSAWIDLNGNGQLDSSDAQQSFAVAVAGQLGSGRFVVFGDDAIFQNKFLTGDNLILGRNLAAWLATEMVTRGK